MSDLQVSIREEGPVKRRLEIHVPAARVTKETDDLVFTGNDRFYVRPGNANLQTIIFSPSRL